MLRPRVEHQPFAFPYVVLRLPRANGEYTNETDGCPRLQASTSPSSLTGLEPGTYIAGTDGTGYIANSSGTPIKVAVSGAAQTWVGLQTFGDGLALLDNDVATWGTGGDFTITHDGSNTNLTSATGHLLIDNTSATGQTRLDLGTDTSATSVRVRNNSGTVLWQVAGDGTITQPDGTTVQRTGAGTGTGDVIERVGATATEGMEVRVYEAIVSPAAIETALLTLPANHVVDSVQANVQAALTGGGTTVTFGIGITGDVDAYGTASSAGSAADLLTKNAKINAIGTKTNAGASVGVFSGSTVAVKLIGAATGGTTAGDTALTVGSVRVVIRYRVLLSLPDVP